MPLLISSNEVDDNEEPGDRPGVEEEYQSNIPRTPAGLGRVRRTTSWAYALTGKWLRIVAFPLGLGLSNVVRAQSLP